MRYGPEHKAQTRQRILEAAARVFRRKGFHASGVDAVMAEAGLTAGAFYGHFESKEALFAECMRSIFEDRRTARENGLDELSGAAWVEGVITNYLSVGHLEDVGEGCPLPALAPEMGRASVEMQEGFQCQLGVWADELEQALELEYGRRLDNQERRTVALGAISAMVGGMTLARAMPDRERAERILDGARQMAIGAVRSGLSGVEGRVAPQPAN